MKKIVLAICIVFSMVANAQGIDNLRFGTAYNDALTLIKAQYGSPLSIDSESVTYKNVSYQGFKWNEVVFKFTNGKLSEARYYMNQKNKILATKRITDIAKTMEKTHVITKDYEDDGNLFYAGGKSPMGFGHLFTIFVSPRNGVWTSQLRFGPFRS